MNLAATAEPPLLSVAGLSKKYCADYRKSLRYAVADTVQELRARPTGPRRLRTGEFWALEDLSFTLRRGEALGIVGGNGAGKSTLLKLIYGLLKPDVGELCVRGSVGALIELGTGLNPLLSGRENILLGAAINGLSRAQEARLTQEVVAFAELGDAIDAPFQTYSSGMKARLAFSLIAMLRPDLLIVDEVLAVGDLGFQRKCLAFMRTYLAEGGALVFVSHNGHQVQSICQRAILLDRGSIRYDGGAVEALHKMYEQRSRESRGISTSASGPIVIEALTGRGAGAGDPCTGAPAEIVLRYRATEAIVANWAVTIWSADGWVCITTLAGPGPRPMAAGTGELVFSIPRLPLTPGRYVLTAAILDPETWVPFARTEEGASGAEMEVRAPSSVLANIQRQRGQIVEIEGHWR